MVEYNKLVRDKIPEIIAKNGEKPISHVATDIEYPQSLLNKLTEEVNEFISSGEVEELVDIMEVVEAIGVFKGVPINKINQIKKKKQEEKGGFSKRIILDRVEE